ncbi:MAG: ATP-binding protein [Verrucomicrobia bacterium]|nr:ATP-binding protein [Verrucomicrobiota bacterium]
MEIRVGPPVVDADHFERPELTAQLQAALTRGSVAFLGPRRTGKTSQLLALAAAPGKFLPVYCDVEHCFTPEQWLLAVLEASSARLEQGGAAAKQLRRLWDAFAVRVRKFTILGASAELAPAPTPDFRALGEEFARLLRESEVPLAFLLDEFPWFVQNLAPEPARQFLSWFRQLRIEAVRRPVRFVLTGSIGLAGVVRRLGLGSTVNDLEQIRITPLSSAEAESFLERLTRDNGIALSAEGRREVIALLGSTWPYFLQLFVAALQQHPRDAVTGEKAHLARLYEEEITSSRNEFCRNMRERLRAIFTPAELLLAQAVLRRLEAPAGLTAEEVERVHAELVPDPLHRAQVEGDRHTVLETLEHDGYVVRDQTAERRYRFASHILRDYWRRHP